MFCHMGHVFSQHVPIINRVCCFATYYLLVADSLARQIPKPCVGWTFGVCSPFVRFSIRLRHFDVLSDLSADITRTGITGWECAE